MESVVLMSGCNGIRVDDRAGHAKEGAGNFPETGVADENVQTAKVFLGSGEERDKLEGFGDIALDIVSDLVFLSEKRRRKVFFRKN